VREGVVEVQRAGVPRILRAAVDQVLQHRGPEIGGGKARPSPGDRRGLALWRPDGVEQRVRYGRAHDVTSRLFMSPASTLLPSSQRGTRVEPGACVAQISELFESDAETLRGRLSRFSLSQRSAVQVATLHVNSLA
jgi:hypothetical protein